MESRKIKATAKYQPNPVDINEQKIARALEIQEKLKELANTPRALELQEKLKELAKTQSVIADPLSAELSEIKEYFLKLLDKPNQTKTEMLTPSGAAILKLSNSYSIPPEAMPSLRKIYQDDLAIFVTEKNTFAPTAALRKLLNDSDYKYKKVIREAVSISQSRSIVFEPVVKSAEGSKKGAKK